MEESLYIIPPLSIVGIAFIIAYRRSHRAVLKWTVTSIIAYLFYVIVFHRLANLDLRPLYLGVQARFWPQANMYIFVFGALGLEVIYLYLFNMIAPNRFLRVDASYAAAGAFSDKEKENSGEHSINSAAADAAAAGTGVALNRLGRSVPRDPAQSQSSGGSLKRIANIDPCFAITSFVATSSSASAQRKDARGVSKYQPKPSITLYKLTKLSSFFLVCIVLSYCIAHFAHSLPRTNQSDTMLLAQVGEVMIDSFPKGSIVLLNGDLNNNIVKYRQTCLNERPDLHLVSLQLMTWSWFVEMQARHYPGVIFPGKAFHPRVPGSFSIAQFLDANYNTHPIILCGGWKEGDDSWARDYTKLPYGSCDQVLRRRDVPTGVALAKFLRKSLAAIPRYTDLGVFDRSKYTDDTWEYAVRNLSIYLCETS